MSASQLTQIASELDNLWMVFTCESAIYNNNKIIINVIFFLHPGSIV